MIDAEVAQPTGKRFWTKNEGMALVGTSRPLRKGTVSGSVGVLWIHWDEKTGEQVPILGQPRCPGYDLVGWTEGNGQP